MDKEIENLRERLLKVETMIETLSTGQSLMAAALENAGLMREGEPVKPGWDPEKIKWVQTEGIKGPYLRYPAQGQKAESTEDYKNMLLDLKRQDGKMFRGNYFIWIFTDGATVGRKLLKGTKSEPQTQKNRGETVEKVRAKFPSDLQSLLTFKREGSHIIIRPTSFLRSDNFSKILSVVRDQGGKYVSSGKESHFRVPNS